MKLSEQAIRKIKDSRSLSGKIRASLGVSKVTMWKYLRDNNEMLTLAAVVKLIRDETRLSNEEILESADVELQK